MLAVVRTSHNHVWCVDLLKCEVWNDQRSNLGVRDLSPCRFHRRENGCRDLCVPTTVQRPSLPRIHEALYRGHEHVSCRGPESSIGQFRGGSAENRRAIAGGSSLPKSVLGGVPPLQ